jgi:hypothetical protein
MGSFQVVFKSSTITQVHHKDPDFFEVIFYGYSGSEEFRKSFQHLLTCTNPRNAWLLDQKYMHVNPDDLSWATDAWFAQATSLFPASGKVAIVPPVNFVGQHHMSKFVEQVALSCPKLQMIFFDDYDKACDWIVLP